MSPEFEVGIADIVEIREFSELPNSRNEVLIVGKKSGVYCEEKICQLENLLWFYKQKKFMVNHYLFIIF